ncbi:MAG: hypothetical protein R3F56_26260 [Planctomycetota bacterium]
MVLRALRMRVRSTLRWRRGAPALPHQDKAALFAHLGGARRDAAEAREAELRARYDLAPLHARSTRLVYRDNLALLDVLERLVGDRDLGLGARVRAVDVGAQDWRYVFALERFWRLHRAPAPRAVELLGVEVDGHVVYPNLHARCDVASAYARQLDNGAVRYLVADFRRIELEARDVVTLFFPFLTAHALRRWGLPDHLFDPNGLMARARATLRPGGALVLLHQTARERDIGFALLAEQGVSVVASISAATDLVHDGQRTVDRFATLAISP